MALYRELEETCLELNLPFSGLKGALVQRIVDWVILGKLSREEPIPEISRAKRGVDYPLHPETSILHGGHRNDAKTRLFLKELVGDHFHFTARGIDWIKGRWAAGDPPTYREFAIYWQQQYEAKREERPAPKEEWAFIRFTQGYLETRPKASRQEITLAWKEEQQRQVQKAKEMIQSYLSTSE